VVHHFVDVLKRRFFEPSEIKSPHLPIDTVCVQQATCVAWAQMTFPRASLEGGARGAARWGYIPGAERGIMAKPISNMTDAEFKAFIENFLALITLNPTSYGLVAGDATALAVVESAFVDALSVALAPSTRTSVTVEQKNTARDACENAVRYLIGRIEFTPSVTDAQKLALGINVRKPATAIQPPDAEPVLVVKKVDNRTVTIRLMQPEGDGRGKPENVYSAVVYSYVGPEPIPQDINLWKNEGVTTRTDFTINFPLSVPAFSKVWLTAAWQSPRLAAGPACEPISTFLGSGVVTQVA